MGRAGDADIAAAIEEPPACGALEPLLGASEEDHEAAALNAWTDASAKYAIWPGVVVDAQLAKRTLESVGFLSVDELMPLETERLQHLVEYHRKHLTLVHPPDHRFATV